MSVSKVQVDNIQSLSGGKVEIPFGATVPAGKTLSASGNLNVSVIVTATSFSGSASGLSNLPTVLSAASFGRMWTRI